LKLIFLVFARDEKHVKTKVEELQELGFPFLIVCGKDLDIRNVIYRKPMGKFDAINFGLKLLPLEFDTVALNDVDTKIINFEYALRQFIFEKAALLFSSVSVKEGPQKSFYPLLDAIRSHIPITASGELMIVQREIIDRIVPIKPCKAEDTYILFKFAELKQKAIFCKKCYVETDRTKTVKKEEEYKRRVVCGIYQALLFTRPALSVRFFYLILPLIAPALLIFGKLGYSWMRGILLGYSDYLHGDRNGIWKPTYLG
jgi:cellulose synthase/poly-beta-1,6-N-acetylglucosamine synthase-like glycosyltransferase